MHFAIRLAAVALAAVCSAQTITIPPGTAGTEGNSSNAFPWGSTSTTFPGLRIQCVYDSTNFTSQGVTAPVLIQRLRWRANAAAATTTWVGGTYAAAAIALSTCPIDWTAITSTFATNEGADKVVCYSGPVQFLAGAGLGTAVPGPTVVDVTLTTPFLYDPAAGDLVIDADHLLGANFTPNTTGTNRVSVDVQTTGALAARAFASSLYPAPNGTLTPNATVITIDYVPANTLSASFTASATSGPSPLTVNFTNTSYTSDPGGITSYSWDFNGDAVIDSNLPNPSFNYASCGNFTVSLTVTDASHPPSTRTITNMISTDDITANFTRSYLAAPNLFQFTDTSTPPATAWSWDFNGDAVPDSFVQNPIVPLTLYAPSSVTLTATRNCKSSAVTKTGAVAPNTLGTPFNADNGLSANFSTVYFDILVTNPQGVNIHALEVNTGTTAVGTPFTLTAYITPGSHTGLTVTPSAWRQVATGSGTAGGNNVPAPVILTQPFYLTPGSYGFAVYHVGAGVRYTGTAASGPPTIVGNGDMTLTLGSSRGTTSPFTGGTLFNPRVWNGTILYDTCTTAATAGMGFFGTGCAGTMPVSQQSVSSFPVPGGNLTVTWNNLPFNFAAALVGFSNTLFQGSVPLPTDLAAIGAPGCPLRVSDDMMFLQFGAANQTTLNVPVPPDPALLCVEFYTQAAVADTVNAFGFVMSEAWAGMVGN